MRNIIVFTRVPILPSAVEGFLAERGADFDEVETPRGRRTRGIVERGKGEGCAFVSTDTSLTMAIVDDQDYERVRAELGFDPQSCVDIHFTSSDAAWVLADTLAREMAARWNGTIDYTGSGGTIGQPPPGKLMATPLFGTRNPDPSAVAEAVARILGCTFVLHDSAFLGGDYYRAGGILGGTVIVQTNYDAFNDELAEEEWPDMKTLVRLDGDPTPSQDAAARLEAEGAIVGLSRLGVKPPPSPSALRELIPAYLHQDWPLEASSIDEVMDQLVRDAEPAVLRSALTELEALLASDRSPAELRRFYFDELGSYYDPEAGGGETVRSFLSRLRRRFEEALGSRKA